MMIPVGSSTVLYFTPNESVIIINGFYFDPSMVSKIITVK